MEPMYERSHQAKARVPTSQIQEHTHLAQQQITYSLLYGTKGGLLCNRRRGMTRTRNRQRHNARVSLLWCTNCQRMFGLGHVRLSS